MDGIEARVHVTEFKYDFAIHGGAVAARTIQDKTIPAGAHILGALILDPSTDLAGASTTVSLGIVAGADLHALDAIADVNAGPIWADQLVIGETAPLVTTSQEGLIVTFAVAVLTAGVFRVKVFWVHG